MNDPQSNLEAILKANQKFAENFATRAQLSAKPLRKCAILTCMDARMDPVQFAGIREGDAHVIRNAGGRASEDAIRSLVISHKLLGTEFWFVIQHTQCGMATISDKSIANLLSESLMPSVLENGEWKNVDFSGGSQEGHNMTWHCIDNLQASVTEDVARIADHPLVSPKISIYGYIYDVATGLLSAVDGALRIGECS